MAETVFLGRALVAKSLQPPWISDHLLVAHVRHGVVIVGGGAGRDLQDLKGCVGLGSGWLGGVDSEGEAGLLWLAANVEATEISNKRRKIRFMLDLTALEARFPKPQPVSSLQRPLEEEGRPILTRAWARWKKQCWLRRAREQPEGQVLVGQLLIVGS